MILNATRGTSVPAAPAAQGSQSFRCHPCGAGSCSPNAREAGRASSWHWFVKTVLKHRKECPHAGQPKRMTSDHSKYLPFIIPIFFGLGTLGLARLNSQAKVTETASGQVSQAKWPSHYPSNALLPSVSVTSGELPEFKNNLVGAVDFSYLIVFVIVITIIRIFKDGIYKVVSQ